MKRPAVIVPAILAALAFAVSAVLYTRLPHTVAIHWNLHGEPDGFAPRPFAAFFLPVVILLTSALHGLAHRFDPRKVNLQRSSTALTVSVIALAIVVTAAHLAILAVALGIGVSIPALAIGCVGLLLTISGNYMGKTRSNFAFGIRNRWTLSDERVWDRTHRVAGRIFVAEGLAAMLIAVSGSSGPRSGLAVISVLVGTLVIIQFYAYREWRKLHPAAKN
ncbi:MAG TPA: DUF1648 domain-containing protein [Noviherbaspirillum sp.]|uniref:SdpI family protein n=1 Tax=Noviherbaspirillum sp. TaxID=1926288 RepID=UPI002D2E17F7|nr:DUF1648 domain-containing protein [Noviherbaspirillum sp.]HYD97238.1 DUF1648 domain-containing protein [Noviherbaspirillum sp.]